MIDGLTNGGSLPALERVLQFAGRRQELLTNNVANIATPGFRPSDVSVADFQALLGDAIDGRRTRTAEGGPLDMDQSAQIETRGDRMILHPTAIADNLLFHDGNDRSLERLMQGLVENFMAFRTTAELVRSRYEILNVAIRERI